MASKNPPETRYAIHLIEEWIKTTGSGGVSAVARELSQLGAAKGLKSVTRTQINNIISGTRGVGDSTRDLLAAKFHNGSVDEFRQAAREYAAAHPSPTAWDRYDSRAMAERWAREAGIPEYAIETVKKMSLEGPDPGPRFWLDLMDSHARVGPGKPIGEEAPPSSREGPQSPARRR